MAISVHIESFESIWDQWEEILSTCSTNTVFVTPWWQKTWWDNFGEGHRAHILSVSDGDDLLGIAPLMARDGALTFLGDKDLSDYFDFIVPRQCVSRFYPALCEYLQGTEWKTLDLYSVPHGSPTLEYLPDLATERGWKVEIEEEQTTPRTILPDTWEGFLSGLRRKDRHELRRKLRRLDREGGHRQFSAYDEDDPDASMQRFFTLLRASSPDKEEFLTPERERFFMDVARESASRNLFRLYFLEVGGAEVAACICFDYGGAFLLYNSGYDPDYSRLSVGLLNKALSIKTAIEEGREVFNFLKGNERYKYNLGGRDEAVFRLRIVH